MEKSIEHRLKELRAKLGLTQREIAISLDMKSSYYSDLENGHRTITGKFIKKLQDKYNISADWMYTGKGEIYTLNSNQLLHPLDAPLGAPLKKSSLKDGKNLLANAAIDEMESSVWPADYFNPKDFYLSSNFEKKLLVDVILNHKEINELTKDFNDFQIFERIIYNLNVRYFNKIHFQLHSAKKYLADGKFDYEGYKADFIAEVKKFDKIKPILHRIAKAIRQFYIEFEDFDTEGILRGYLGEKPRQ